MIHPSQPNWQTLSQNVNTKIALKTQFWGRHVGLLKYSRHQVGVLGFSGSHARHAGFLEFSARHYMTCIVSCGTE